MKAWLASAGVPRSFFAMYLNIALYAVAFQMVQVSQPYLMKQLVGGGVGGSAAVTEAFTTLKTVNGVAQMVGSLLSGVLLDRLGCRAVMLLSFGASLASYGLMAVPSANVWLLFYAQLPTLLQHAMLAAQFFVSVKAEPDRRSVLLGYISVCYGVGVVIGPALGGWLSGYDLRLPAVVATVASALSLAITLLDPEMATARSASVASRSKSDLPEERAGGNGDVSGGGARVLPSTLSAFVTEPVLLSRFALKALFSASLALFFAVYQLLALDRFGMDVRAAGALTSFIGVVGVATQAGLLAALKARFSERQILTACAATLAVAFAAFSTISSSAELFTLVVPLVIANTIFQTVSTAQILSVTELKGAAGAVNMAIFSGLRMVMPAVGNYLLARAGFWSIGASSSAASAVMLSIMLVYPACVSATADLGLGLHGRATPAPSAASKRD